MTDVNKLYTDFFAQISQIRTECSKSVQEHDAVEQDLLHFLENETCDAVTMVIIAKKLQENRRARRYNKVRLEQIQSITHVFPSMANKRNLTRFEEKDYTYKSNVMSEITHKPKKITRCKSK